MSRIQMIAPRFMSGRIVRLALLGLTAIAATASQASAAPIVGGAIVVATDGHVIAKYLGTSASYTDLLYLDSPAGAYTSLIFNNHATPVGTTVDLGAFTAGTELIFRIDVTNTGDKFYSGLASRNADGKAHARVTSGYSATETLVEFEDLYGTPEGDRGFNDLSYTFTNVRATEPTAAPEPSTLALIGSGLVGIVAVAVRRRGRPA